MTVVVWNEKWDYSRYQSNTIAREIVESFVLLRCRQDIIKVFYFCHKTTGCCYKVITRQRSVGSRHFKTIWEEWKVFYKLVTVGVVATLNSTSEYSCTHDDCHLNFLSYRQWRRDVNKPQARWWYQEINRW